VTVATPRAELDRRLPVGRALLAQTGMELRLLVRSAESLLVTFGIPIGVLAFFSTVDVLPTGDRDAADFLVPGVLAISVAATGLVAVSIQTAFERKYGVLKRLGGTPLPRWAFLAAKGLAVGALLLLQTVLTLAIAAGPLGWRPAGGIAVAAFAVVVGAIAHTALGLLIAGSLRAEATLALSNALFLVLLVVSGVTFEADVLPDGLAAIGRLLPVGALGEALRTAFDGGLPWTSLALVAGWGVAAIALATRTFRWEP
jgi:ABC-2 type transport system permease protein